MSKEKRVVFFEGKSWYHRTKELQDDLTTKYGKKGGFETPEEVEEGYWDYEKRYKKKLGVLQIAKMQKTDVMLGNYLEYWFENIFSPRIETTTRMVGAYTLYNLILPSMEADIKLKYISVEYLDALLERVAKICPSAGNKGREILNMAMKEAVIGGYIKTNPVTGTKPYKRQKPKITILSKEKIKVLLKASSENNWYLEILLGLFCGLRKGEILGLKFSDLDMEKRTVTIRRQIASDPLIKKGSGSKIDNYGLIERDPKTPNSFRVLRVPAIIIEELEKRRRLVESNKVVYAGQYDDKDYISCQKNGKLHSLSALNSALTGICSKNGLPHITVHGLRHMYATILIEMGVPLIKISALLGHGSVHTTFEYYCDVMDENENILAFMNQAFVPVERRAV